MTEVSVVDLEVDGQRLSGREAKPEAPARALLFALHGGSYSSRYYDLQGSPTASAIQNYASLGYHVVALDRPGYAASFDVAPESCGFPAQAATLHAAFDQIYQRNGQGLPAFVIGHSIGGMIAMTMAAGPIHPEIRGVMASGMGMVWQPGILEMWSSLLGDDTHVSVPNEARDQIMFAAAGDLVDAAVQADAGQDLHPIPAAELRDAVGWHNTMPAIASDIRVPVLHVLPEHDGIWASDHEARARAADVLKGIEGSEVMVQRAAGHSLDAHRAGWAHHLATAAFVETCIAVRP